jgi:peptide methionine sulfoxide reductase msrA/msrB
MPTVRLPFRIRGSEKRQATHAETLKLGLSDILSLDKIFEMYLRVVDPYTLNQQGNDVGLQYRSGVYYTDLLDAVAANSYFSSHLKPGYVIEIKKLDNFYPAESYHQDYLDKNPGGYCHIDLRKIRPEEKK